MCTKFLLKVLSYERGRDKLLSFCPGRYFLCAPVKSYPFLRTTASVPSEVYHKDGADSTECLDSIISLRKHYFVNYLLNQEEYKSLILEPYNLNFEIEGRPESVEILKNLTDSSEDEELIEKLNSSLLKEKEILNVEEICKFLFWTYKHKDNNLAKEIASLLETELVNRKLSRHEILMVLFTLTETWARINPKSFLHMKLSSKMCFKISSLTPKQLIALFYCKLRITKSVLKHTNYSVTNHVTNIIPSLDSTELGIITRGLSQGNFSCYSWPLKRNIWKRTVELIESIPEATLLTVCKFLRENITYMEGHDLLKFQQRLIPNLSKYNYINLNNVVATGVKIGCLDPGLWEKVANMYKENINNCNLQKILSLVITLTQCGIDDEELLKLATERFERTIEDGTIEYLDNRRNLVFFLNNLIHHRLYPKKLFDLVFAEGLTFFKPDVKYGHYTRAKYWETKCFLDIDKPEFNYNSFSEKEAGKLYKLSSYVLFNMEESIHCSNNNNNNVYYALKAARKILVDSYGDEKVYFSAWHSVYPKGLFLRFDQNLNAQPIPDDFKSVEDFYPKKALKDDHIWVFVAVMTSMHYFGGQKVTLTTLTQMRHLQAFGYKFIPVQYNTFRSHINENTANEYLNNLINEHLHKTS